MSLFWYGTITFLLGFCIIYISKRNYTRYKINNGKKNERLERMYKFSIIFGFILNIVGLILNIISAFKKNTVSI